ncbi:hypothetical protein DFQ28_001111 [Apophysomyces sp. BC1034]|nr:hypothetical protein DFQ30_001776 [Apophysomyces sp. BC1015]KAG0183736.1 hypothetical protein DFQ28_001111 [Apophysomyces sp. BC1034]
MLDEDETLCLESHVQHILALSSIFFVKPLQFHEDVKTYIPNTVLDQMVDDLQTRYHINKRGTPLGLLSKTLPLLDNVRTRRIDQDEATARLLLLKGDLPRDEFRIAKSIAMLLQKLPENRISNTIMEQELLTRFIEPALAPLFENTIGKVIFRWTATTNDECRETTVATISQDRPDACISNLDGVMWGATLSFGEVKCFSQMGNNFVIAKDLVRLALFAKNSIDVHNLHGVLVFQVIGRHAFFYLVNLLSDALYIMLEIGNIELPGCLMDLPAYVAQAHRLLDILSLYDDMCISWTATETKHFSTRKRKTLAADTQNNIIDKTRNRKRPSITSFKLSYLTHIS